MLEVSYNRQAQRRAVDIACTIIGPRWDEPLTYRMTDLSPGGMWVRTTFPLPEGEHVVVAFRPPPVQRGSKAVPSSELMLFARVARAERARVGSGARHRTGGMGLEFCDLGRADRRKLQRSLRYLPVCDRRVDEQLCAPLPVLPWREVRGRW